MKITMIGRAPDWAKNFKAKITIDRQRSTARDIKMSELGLELRNESV